MPADINIELNLFDEEVAVLGIQNSSMYSAIDSVKGSLEGLGGTWDGAGGSAYEDALSCIKAGLIENSRGLEQLIQKLELARTAMEEADTTGAR